jgi:ribosomal protein L12E/L44/L45/RPP1/RPP2
LPILFAALGAIGAEAGGSAAIANGVKTSQHQNAEEEELKRHNKEMEKIAKGSGLKKKK